MTESAGRLFQGADWNFATLQRILEAGNVLREYFLAPSEAENQIVSGESAFAVEEDRVEPGRTFDEILT